MASISLFILALLVVSGVVSSQAPITGGLSDIDVNHHTVKDLVKHLPSMTNELKGLEIVKVVRAQRQVVAGFRYVLTIQTRSKGSNGPANQECEASVWIQSWLERRTLTSMTCKPVTASVYAMGMFRPLSLEEIPDTVHQAVNDGLEIINSECECMYRKGIFKFISAQQKVVAGMLYRIKVGIIDTVCRNSEENQGKGLTECPALEGAVTQVCMVSVWIRPWLKMLNRRTLISMTCAPVPALGIPGSWSKGEITDTVRQAANIGLELINSGCNCMYRKSITQVKSVQEKVVAGMLYRIRVGIIDTVCLNSEENQGKGLKECPALEDAVEKECEITMLSQPWLKPEFRLIKHTC